MGAELGQWNEWWCKGEIEWFLLTYPTHHGLQTMVSDLNHFYLKTPALWEKDFDSSGFSWIDFSDVDNSVISYLRIGQHQKLLCIHNFTPNYHGRYYIPLGNVKEVHELFNTDDEKYGGSGKLNRHVEITKDANGIANGLIVQLAPLATMIFEVHFW